MSLSSPLFWSDTQVRYTLRAVYVRATSWRTDAFSWPDVCEYSNPYDFIWREHRLVTLALGNQGPWRLYTCQISQSDAFLAQHASWIHSSTFGYYRTGCADPMHHCSSGHTVTASLTLRLVIPYEKTSPNYKNGTKSVCYKLVKKYVKSCILWGNVQHTNTKVETEKEYMGVCYQATNERQIHINHRVRVKWYQQRNSWKLSLIRCQRITCSGRGLVTLAQIFLFP